MLQLPLFSHYLHPVLRKVLTVLVQVCTVDPVISRDRRRLRSTPHLPLLPFSAASFHGHDWKSPASSGDAGPLKRGGSHLAPRSLHHRRVGTHAPVGPVDLALYLVRAHNLAKGRPTLGVIFKWVRWIPAKNLYLAAAESVPMAREATTHLDVAISLAPAAAEPATSE